MSKTKDSTTLPDALNLNLPKVTDPSPGPPSLSAADNARLCEKLLPYWNKRRFVDGVGALEPVPEPFKIID